MIDPWFFKDGTPINAEQIRKIAKKSGLFEPAKHAEKRQRIDRIEIQKLARFFAKKFETHLVKVLLIEIQNLQQSRYVPTGNNALDARRQYRRAYQRQYRALNGRIK